MRILIPLRQEWGTITANATTNEQYDQEKTVSRPYLINPSKTESQYLTVAIASFA